MDINLSSSGKKIIASGSFLTFDEKQSTLSLKKDKEEISLNFIFDNKPSENQGVLFSHAKDASKNKVIIDITLKNFNNALPTSFTSPASIARWDNGDKIYLQICVKSISEKTKEVTYTLYEGGKE